MTRYGLYTCAAMLAHRGFGNITDTRRLLARFAAFGLLSVALGGLGGCSTFGGGGSMFPTFGFGSSISSSPDCEEIEARMEKAKKRYASVLSREKPAIYLGFTGNLSKSMKRKRLKGVYQLTDLQLDDVIDQTRQQCIDARLPRSICRGSRRIGDAYQPLLAAARDAHKNYCGDRPIR